MRSNYVQTIRPGSFVISDHFYPKARDAHLHPTVRRFLALDRVELVKRCAGVTGAGEKQVEAMLSHRPKVLKWAGADLFLTLNAQNERSLLVVETNSSPSGHKSMPPTSFPGAGSGYRRLLERVLLPDLQAVSSAWGGLAVLYDKNVMEASGYAAALADLTDEPVLLTPFFANEEDPPVRVREGGTVEIFTDAAGWQAMRGVVRYVTQKPWSRIPPWTKTVLMNPVLACLAGGRNKSLAAKAYESFNRRHEGTGLAVRTPKTYSDVTLSEVPDIVRRLGGQAVVKVPYSNAGQSVFTIATASELEAFLHTPHVYEQFIVQALVGGRFWDEKGSTPFHQGTRADAEGRVHAFDLRFMVGSGEEGFFPCAIYGRRARRPLTDRLDRCESTEARVPPVTSWEMLGTNLSRRLEENTWSTDTDRLLIVDEEGFETLGLDLDLLVDAYLQTILATIAIDDLASSLLDADQRFLRALFAEWNPDSVLLDELLL